MDMLHPTFMMISYELAFSNENIDIKESACCFHTLYSFLDASNVSAEYGIWSGNSWMIVCKHHGTEKNASERYEFYTLGAIEGALRLSQGAACYISQYVLGALPFYISETHSIQRYVNLIGNYIKKHTALLHMPASQLRYNAMSEAFLCARQ